MDGAAVALIGFVLVALVSITIAVCIFAVSWRATGVFGASRELQGPDGRAWQTGIVWDRRSKNMPLTERVMSVVRSDDGRVGKKDQEERKKLGVALDVAEGVALFDSAAVAILAVIGLAVVAISGLLVLVVAAEIIVVVAAVTIGIVGRVLLRHPWEVAVVDPAHTRTFLQFESLREARAGNEAVRLEIEAGLRSWSAVDR